MTEPTPLNPITRADWIAALRSGKYAQGTGQLHSFEVGPEPESEPDENGYPVWKRTGRELFCCLGVACEIAGIPHYPDTAGFEWPVISLEEEERESYIPLYVAELVGISDRDQRACVNLNDARKLSFARIADILEANPELNAVADHEKTR